MEQKYNISQNKHKEYCEFKKECQRFVELALVYYSQSQTLITKVKNQISSNEFSSGGELLHRGYYCPSPIKDIIIGNCNRGRLLKNTTNRSRLSYKYGFNNIGNMIFVEQLEQNLCEIILYDGNSEFGITFSTNNTIQYLSECKKCNGNIQSYTFCLYNPVENCIIEYSREDYVYSTLGLHKAKVYHFIPHKNIPLLQHEEYIFEHDNDGYLSHYTVVDYDANSITPSIASHRVFAIKIRRKL